MSQSFRHHVRQTPIDLRGVRSGYVYVAQSPDRPQICKVGHTTRPPHVRMRELGKTTWLAPMRVNTARFFWDAITVERQMHARLSRWACVGAGEWFELPAPQAASLLSGWVDPVGKHPHILSRQEHGDPQWLSMRMEWAMDQVCSQHLEQKKDGWRDIERLSALGYAPATWLLVERLMVEDACPEHVLWILDAANRQGHQGAVLRRDWVASFTGEDPTRRLWKEAARRFLENKPDPIDWTQEDRATLVGEVDLWRKRPSLAWFDQLPDLVS